jgi:hypothetical protein
MSIADLSDLGRCDTPIDLPVPGDIERPFCVAHTRMGPADRWHANRFANLVSDQFCQSLGTDWQVQRSRSVGDLRHAWIARRHSIVPVILLALAHIAPQWSG